MRQALILHSNCRCRALLGIDVEITRPRPGHLQLRYVATGKIGELKIPPPTVPGRTDELWKHTCFEVFVRATTGDGYYEFNFAPSTEWAAYAFSSYRAGMSPQGEIAAPKIQIQSSADRLILVASLDLAPLPRLYSSGAWRLALSAVIEETSGDKSYWAAAHPPGKPDFHHQDSFAVEIAGDDRS